MIKICRSLESKGNRQVQFYFTFVFVNLGGEQLTVNFFKPFLLPDDREIIDSIKENGIERKTGEQRLFNRYAYFIKQAINKFSLSHEDAFDLYSDTIISAIEKIVGGSFEGRSSLKTWLYQIFHNKYVDLIRKKSTNKSSVHRTLSLSDSLFQVADNSKTIVQQLVDKTDWKVLKEKLNQVGDSCRRMLLLWADGYSDKEIAVSMEYKTSDVVKTSRLRCLERLKQLYHTT